MKDAKEQLGSVLQKDCSAELAAAEENHRSKIAARDECLKEINNEEITTIAYAIQVGTYLNECRKNIFSKVSLDIGTKIATQVLKDGDVVEVDANKGVVKILKKAG